MRAGMILPVSLMKSFSTSMSLYSIHSAFSAVKRQNLRRRNNARCPLSFLSLPNFPLPLPLPFSPLRGGMSCSFYEFDVGYVQHQLFRALAFRAQESLDLDLRLQRRLRQQLRLRLERHRRDLGLHLALPAGFFLLGAVLEPELDHRDAGRGVAQGAQLDDFSADLDFVQGSRLRGRRFGRPRLAARLTAG